MQEVVASLTWSSSLEVVVRGRWIRARLVEERQDGGEDEGGDDRTRHRPLAFMPHAQREAHSKD